MEAIAGRLRRGICSSWRRYEGPTWLVAAAVYGGWASLLWFHARIPLWLMLPLGAVAIAWHNSLQHETIHALVRLPRPLRFALGFPPLALVVPYPIYCRNHRKHHRATRLTDPADDPESYYHREDDWQRYSPPIRVIFLFNQSLVGRLTIGPLLDAISFIKSEVQRVASGDRSNLSAWAWHAVSVGLILFCVGKIAGLPLWQYCCFVVYPGLSLGMLRSFGEHRYAARQQHRTAIVESGFPFNLLFLNNNLHLIHHISPALPWYRIPAVWRASRVRLLERNGGFYMRGYSQIAARHAFGPVFDPVYPHGDGAIKTERIRIPQANAT
jgi:fatty acid desaturase